MIIIFLCVFVLTAWCAFTNVLLPYVLYVVTECNRKIDIWNLDSRINSRMEPEVYNNMMKCITNALSPKRVSDPAYGKDWLIDWLMVPWGILVRESSQEMLIGQMLWHVFGDYTSFKIIARSQSPMSWIDIEWSVVKRIRNYWLSEKNIEFRSDAEVNILPADGLSRNLKCYR